jgi:hypothetical protein
VAAGRSVLASVRAFHSLHKVRFGGLFNATRSDLNSDNSDCEQDDSKDGAVAKRKSSGSRASLAHDNTDSDSSADSKAEPRSTQRSSPKACRTLSTREANAWAVGDHSPSASTDPTGQIPCPAVTRYHPKQLQGAEQDENAHKRRNRATRPTASAMHQAAKTSSIITCSSASRKLPKWKRWERNNTLDSDQSSQLPTNQLQCATDAQPEAFWKRWRQMKPRRGRTP